MFDEIDEVPVSPVVLSLVLDSERTGTDLTAPQVLLERIVFAILRLSFVCFEFMILAHADWLLLLISSRVSASVNV